MQKIEVHLRREELAALRRAAKRSNRSVADLIRNAIRKAVVKPTSDGPVAIWDGEPTRPSTDHDRIYDLR